MTHRAEARTCLVLGLALLGIATGAGCGRDRPVAPTIRALSGHVVLRGYLVDAMGAFAGTRVVGDADDVRVELLLGQRVVASTVTVDGVYRFSGLASATYVARARVNDAIHDETNPVTVTQSEVALRDTLLLASKGDLLPIPNPFVGSMVTYFQLSDAGYVTVRILGAAGDTVRTLINGEGRYPGLNNVEWDDHDQAGNPALAPLYWLTMELGTDVRGALLFR